jgi:hypothetical protein
MHFVWNIQLKNLSQTLQETGNLNDCMVANLNAKNWSQWSSVDNSEQNALGTETDTNTRVRVSVRLYHNLSFEVIWESVKFEFQYLYYIFWSGMLR